MSGPGRRIGPHAGLERRSLVTIQVDGEPVAALEGETVAAALMGAGRRVFRDTARSAAPRGLYCGIGVCYDCLVIIGGQPNRRACMIPVTEGMQVRTQKAWGDEDMTRP